MKSRFLGKAFQYALLSCVLLLLTCSSVFAADGEDVWKMERDGVHYGTVTLSDVLSTGKQSFSIEDKVYNWNYNVVSLNSSCRIEPADFGGDLYITLDSYRLSDGVYLYNDRDEWTATMLLANQTALIGYGYPTYDEMLPDNAGKAKYVPSAGNDVSFVFGHNEMKNVPGYDAVTSTVSLDLYADETLYVLRCQAYRNGQREASFIVPFFIKGSSEEIRFSDVKDTDYFAAAVEWGVKKEITTGTTATTFSPHQTCTTAQILTFLWRANGCPAPSVSNPFSDVSSDAYYKDAAIWAYEKGLVSGTSFEGSRPATRAATVTYLWKLAGSPQASKAHFTDVPENAPYAQAVAWAVSRKITEGTSASTFSPEEICSRAQIITFLYRAFAQ